MPDPIISVVIPTYNQVRFVAGCLASVRAGGPDIEIIVADDGSTDGTREAVAAADPSAIYLWAPNTGGPSAPRNRGFAASRGRYVAFLDMDDLWLPDGFARAANMLDRHPEIDFLFADARYGNDRDGFISWIDMSGQDTFRRLPRHELEPGFSRMERGPLFRMLLARNVVCGCSVLVRRDVFAATGGFDETYWGAEDWEVWLRLAAEKTFGYLNEPVSVYVRHPENMTNNRDRLAGGYCTALRKVLARAKLSRPDRRAVRVRLREALYSHGYMAYDRGDWPAARQRFRAAISAGDIHPVTLALAAASHLPGCLASRVRWLKHRLTGGPS